MPLFFHLAASGTFSVTTSVFVSRALSVTPALYGRRSAQLSTIGSWPKWSPPAASHVAMMPLSA